MKKITVISICFLCITQLFSQQKDYIKPNEAQKVAFTFAIDSLLNDYFILSNFKNEDGEFDLQRKKQFKSLFDEKAYVVDDLSIPSGNNSILLSDYADIVSLKLSKTNKRLMQHPYKRQILLDSILYDQYENKYEIPLKLNKIIYFGLDADNELTEKERTINLLMYISYTTKTKVAKIAGIEAYTADVVWYDCKGEKNGEAFIFAPCNDKDERTENDAFQLDCTCAGEDCLGIVGGTALKGSPCDDKDEDTINDIYNDNCECIGTIKCEVNTPCDDKNENTYNDTYQKDCTCIGNCLIDEEEVKIGSTCNDGNKNTYKDAYQKNCECAGTDCEGEINGTKIVGTKCDDKDIDTVNDVWVENCVCKGVSGCIVNGKTIIIGMPCNDGFDITLNDTFQEDCTCKGEDCNGVIDGNALKGSKCNDSNPNTVNDVYLDDCTCVGTFKKWSIYTGIGGLGYLPFNNGGSAIVNNEINFNSNSSYGGKLSMLLNAANSKFYLNAGVAYSPLNFKTEGATVLQFDTELNSADPPDTLYLNLTNLKETVQGNFFQIPLGISYNIVNVNNIKILIDVVAKPYVQISTPKYDIKADVQYAGEYIGYGNSFILKSEKFILPSKDVEESNNEMLGVINKNGYDQTFEFSRDELESLKLNNPFAIAVGFSFLFNVGNAGAVSFYAHYNHFLTKVSLASDNEQNDLKEFLKNGNKKENDNFNIENETSNFNTTLSNSFNNNTQKGLEAGLSYFKKIK